MKCIFLSKFYIAQIVDQVGVWNYCMKIGPQMLVTAILYVFLFRSDWTWTELSLLYVFFIPVTVLSVVFSSIEMDLFAETIVPHCFFKKESFFIRGFLVLVETLPLILIFSALFFYSFPLFIALKHIFFLFYIFWFYFFAALVIGISFGLYTEKGLNNWVHSVVWILGFGPSPFLGFPEPESLRMFFPGAHIVLGYGSIEGFKLFFYSLILGLVWYFFSISVRPSKKSIYKRT